jgi:hypothetical protein
LSHLTYRKVKLKGIAPKPIPTFKTYKEEAEFWDTHSFADYWDESRMVKAVYKPGPKKAVVHVKMAESLKEEIEQVAKAKDISVSSLLRMWAVEKLRQTPIAYGP